MRTMKRIVFASVLIFALLSIAAAQERPTVQSSSVTITAAATEERVRITAPSSVVQMHVEVYAASGEKLFDQEIRGGNVFDWHLQDGQAQRLAPGTYVCVVTAKSVSGRLTQKIGSVSVAEKSVSVQPAESPQLSAAQAQYIGPVEESSSWTIAGTEDPQTPTVIANDGTDGQMIRGRGALTFRIGNFFSGVDTEQMRLTEAGRLGIGTSTPQAKLDVAGTIRAERFLIVRPKPADSAPTTDSAGVQPLIAGTGTLNHIAKWTPDGSMVGDSGIFETAGGSVGIGTTTPSQALEVSNGRIIATGSQTLPAPGGMLEIGTTITNNDNQASGIRMRNLFNGNASIQQALDVAPTFAPSTSISLARGFLSSAFFAPPPGVTITDAYGGNAGMVYSATSGAVTNGTGFAIRTPSVQGSLKPTTQYGLHIFNQGIAGTTNTYGLFVDAQSGSTNNYSAIFAGGNVGIGTTAPITKLDVAGRVNSTGYSIGGDGALNNAGTQNIFAGHLAGAFNTTGSQNSFFGWDAGGSLSTTGDHNSFFGFGTYIDTGTNGIGVTLIGAQAHAFAFLGDLTNATAIGANAIVAQSNSLILGDSNAPTNVGIGTDTPTERLTVKTATSSYGFVHMNGDPTFSGTIVVGSYVGGSAGGGWFGTKSNHELHFFVGDGSPSMTIATDGNVSITHLTAANTQLCTNTSKQIINCVSSLRYKTDVQGFLGGLDIVKRLRPIAFTWKHDGTRDVGLGAEEVDKVAPLLTFRNDKGEVEGVRYNQLSAVFINAFKEQQAQITQQQVAAKQQQDQIAALRTANTALNARLQLIERTLKTKRGSIHRRR